MLFFLFKPCEQGRQLKRIHWVANIGTALKFLEGRRVGLVALSPGYSFFFSLSFLKCMICIHLLVLFLQNLSYVCSPQFLRSA